MELELCELERAELAELELGRIAQSGPNRTAHTSLLGSFWEPFWSHFGSHFGVILGAIFDPGRPRGPRATHGETRETKIWSFFIILGASGRENVLIVQARRKL